MKRRAHDNSRGKLAALSRALRRASLPHMAGYAEPPIVDQEFDSGTLCRLRGEVHMYALLAGLPEGRAADVIVAVHELAANAVHHGAGTGRLRIWGVPGVVLCQVEDGHPPASSAEPTYPLLIKPGQGLWIASQAADQIHVRSGMRGTYATVTFELPRFGGFIDTRHQPLRPA